MEAEENEVRHEMDWTGFEDYAAYLFEPSRAPSRGGNTGALHTHVIKIGDEKFSFFAVGTKKWAFKGDQIRFAFVVKDGKYKNIVNATFEVRDKTGELVVRGDRSWKQKLRTSAGRLPGSRRDMKD